MGKKLHYGIIGCGMMGREHIKNVNLLPGAEVIAIIEPDLGMQAEARKLAPNAEFYADIPALLAVEALDCLIIVSPNHLHCQQLEEVASIREIPILVEKPLFTAPDDLAQIDKFSETYSAPVWVAMEYRYMPPVTKFIESLKASTGGVKMLTIREHRFPFLEKVGNWNRFNENSGGTLVEKCCHFFDLMRHIIGSEPTRIMASGNQALNHLDESYDDKTPDIWDNAYVIVDFKNGARAMLDLCMFAEGSKYQEEIMAIGENGKIEVQVPGPTRFWPEHLGEPPVPLITLSPRNPTGPTSIEVPVDPKLLEAGDHNGSSFYQHQKFAAVVRGEQDIEVTLSDGKKAVLMGQAAQKSAITGQAVILDF